MPGNLEPSAAEHNQESARASRPDFQPYITSDHNLARQDPGHAESQQTVRTLFGCPTIVGKDGTIFLQGHVSNDPEKPSLKLSPSALNPADLEKIGVGLARGIGESTLATLEFLAQPNAVNNEANSLAQTIKDGVDYYSAQPDRITPDAQAASYNVQQVLVETLGHPLPPEKIGELAGKLITGIIPIGASKVLGLKELEALGGAKKLEQLSAAELEELGLKRTFPDLQPASPELIETMRRHGRAIQIAEPGSDEWKYLRSVGVNGRADGPYRIVLIKDAPKITAIEEFLHGTQNRVRSCMNAPPEVLEVRVKDFMTRHSRMLGLTPDDVSVLDILKHRNYAYALRRGFTQFEIEDKQW